MMDLKLEIGELFDEYEAKDTFDFSVFVPAESRKEFGDKIVAICEKYTGQKLEASQAREAELQAKLDKAASHYIMTFTKEFESYYKDCNIEYKALKEVAEAAICILQYLSFNQALILNDKLKELARLEASDE